MKKILCLTDFSEKAYNGILYANELAQKISGSLILMHIYQVCADWDEKALYHPSLIKYSDTESRDKLYKICIDFVNKNKYTNVQYEFVVREGNVQQNLNTIIKEKNIDLVVASIEGELTPTDTYYGNIISGLVQKTNCPVLTVPTGYQFQGIQNIVYAFDLEHENTIEKEAVDFTKQLNATLDILSYTNEEDEIVVEQLYSKYGNMKKDSGYGKMNLDIKATENKIDSLNQFIVDRKADLLILENHKRLLYKQLTETSFTRVFVFFAKLPVLVIRSKEN